MTRQRRLPEVDVRERLGANGVKFVWTKHVTRRGKVKWRRTKYFFSEPGDYRRRAT